MLTSPSLRFRITASLAPIAALLAAAACSSGGGTGGGGSGGATSSSSSSSSSSSGSTTTSSNTGGAECSGTYGDGTTCPGGNYGSAATAVPGGSAKAVIVDETGAPVAGQPIYVCGTDVCSDPSMTGSDGSANISSTLMMKSPAFKFGDAVNYAELAVPMPTQTNDFTALGTGKLATGKLSGKPGAPLEPGTAAVSGDVTVSLPVGASVVIDPLIYDTCDTQLLRTVNIPLDNLGPLLDPVMAGGAPAAFSLVYGLGPAGTTVCPAAKVTVALPNKIKMPNDLDWAPGAEVEFWITTVSVAQVYAPYAGWAKMSDGAVSADGKTASTLDSGGFTSLESFAIRLKGP